MAQQFLALSLFVPSVDTDNSNNTVSFYYLTISTNCFYWSTNFHS